jgi:cytochrome b6-f complex iron-sulfur subunit
MITVMQFSCVSCIISCNFLYHKNQISMDRKQFLLTGCALCGFGVAATMLDSCSKTVPVDFTLNLNDSANAALGNVGGYVIANGGNTIVIKRSSGFVAYSLVCTHEGAIVNYNGNSFQCPRHGATFNSTGGVTGGPASSSLPAYVVTQSGTILTVKG